MPETKMQCYRCHFDQGEKSFFWRQKHDDEFEASPVHSGRKKNTLKRTHLACRRVRDLCDREHGVLALHKRTKNYETGWTETLAAMQRGRQHPC